MGVVCLPGGVLVQGLKVNCAPWFARLLWAYDHLVTPRYWGANRDWLDDAQADVLIKTCFDFVLPMDRDWDGGVVGNGVSIRVNHEADGRP